MARIEIIGGRTMNRAARKVLPRSLLGRSLLMILLPLILLQAVALQIFYGSHLDLVSRRLSGSVVSEIAFTLDMLNRFHDPKDRAWILRKAHEEYELVMTLDRGARLPHHTPVNILGPMDDELAATLRFRFHSQFIADWTSNPDTVFIQLQLPDGVLHVAVPRKRLYAGSFYIFVAWLAGVSALVFGIAALFMRNQVRAIRRLAGAAEAFGRGRDIGPIKPEGAVEVRKAATAFNRMQERILRFLAQRTEMLAGVSHDLRTPLTRLRLALEVMPQTEANQQDVIGMKADVEEMDRMITGYLAFARGEGSEQAEEVNLSALLEEVAAGARRAGAEVALDVPPTLTLSLRGNAVRRAVTNLVDNARRHAKHIGLAALLQGRSVLVMVDDDGPGIPPDRRESVFRPFESGAAGGTGLGLTIARDIVRAHGGEILLEDSPLGGLRAQIRLPV
ncbi:MAG TPA: ATP-binding protein [Acetobacteraceae bacterium]|nr:ATP-binding protein [Acetobacteraceae bacterium]